jgi:hypothetical protein
VDQGVAHDLTPEISSQPGCRVTVFGDGSDAE